MIDRLFATNVRNLLDVLVMNCKTDVESVQRNGFVNDHI